MNKQDEAYRITEKETAKEDMISKLKRLGLTGYASRSLITILENQPLSATSICNLTGIPDSKIYYALKELEERSLVSVQHGTPNLYRVTDVNSILENITRQIDEDRAEKIATVTSLKRQLEPLIKKSKQDVAVELAYIVKGFRGVSETMKEVIFETRSELQIMVSSNKLLESILVALKDAKTRNVNIDLFVTEDVIQHKSLRSWSPKKLLCDCDIIISDSAKVVTASQTQSDDCYAIITQDPTIIRISKDFSVSPQCSCSSC